MAYIIIKPSNRYVADIEFCDLGSTEQMSKAQQWSTKEKAVRYADENSYGATWEIHKLTPDQIRAICKARSTFICTIAGFAGGCGKHDATVVKNTLNKMFSKLDFFCDLNSQQRIEVYARHKSSGLYLPCLLYTSPSPRDRQKSRMPSSA